jgi:hypothetical protein
MTRVPRTALAAGVLCAALACVPTGWYAETFAHPSRVEKLGGAIPEATVNGAVAFRVALAAGALLIPLWSFVLARMCEDARPMRARPLWPTSRRGWLVLGAIASAGAIVRMMLATQSLWYDEISAFLSFAIEGPGVAFGSYVVPTNHVPMTLATWAAWTLSGGSLNELVLRAPALIAGIAAIPVGYALAATVLPRRIAWLGALAVAAAPIAVLESVEARGYAFVILAALVAALAYARAMRTRAMADYVLFACACGFGAWAHPVAILVPIAAGLIGLVRDRRLAVAALLSGTIAAILLAPLSGDVLATKRDYLQRVTDQPTILARRVRGAACVHAVVERDVALVAESAADGGGVRGIGRDDAARARARRASAVCACLPARAPLLARARYLDLCAIPALRAADRHPCDRVGGRDDALARGAGGAARPRRLDGRTDRLSREAANPRRRRHRRCPACCGGPRRDDRTSRQRGRLLCAAVRF